jgi:hypothetical protein
MFHDRSGGVGTVAGESQSAMANGNTAGPGALSRVAGRLSCRLTWIAEADHRFRATAEHEIGKTP